METTTKLFTKTYYKKLEEAKYEEPTDRAAEIIEEAEDDDRLQLKVRISGKPKVIEASRIQSPEDLVVAFDATEPYDSEVEEDDDEGDVKAMFRGFEDPQTVTARLEIKDVAGDKRSKELDMVYDAADVSSGERLRRLNNIVKETIEEETWFRQFDEDIKSDKIVSYKVTRVRE